VLVSIGHVRFERLFSLDSCISWCMAQIVSFLKPKRNCTTRFEPSIPQQSHPLTPHIKSVARLFEGDERALKLDYGIGKAESYFSYFLLTSACLSHGAQGIVKESVGCSDDTLSYSNFELGVMFCSRLQGYKETDRKF